MSQTRIIVIGGGLAGLAAATYAARQGAGERASVTLLERSSDLGGRAATHTKDGFHFNQGPHALYRGGPAEKAFAELGVGYTFGAPQVKGSVLRNGRLWKLPGSAISLLTTRLLSPSAKLETGMALRRLATANAADYDSVPLTEFIDSLVRSKVSRGLLHGLARLSTYSNAPRELAAGAFIRQFQGEQPVRYLDGGWQTLVRGLERTAHDAGVEIVTGARVEEISHDTAVRGVVLAGGTRLPADAVIVAGTAQSVAKLVPRIPEAAAWRDNAVPSRVAALDIGLSKLPVPGRTFAMSTDEPFYLSLHAPIAKLAPDGSYLISLARYTPHGEEPDAELDLQRLEGFLDLAQPGWRKYEVTRQFLPDMIVQSGLPLAANGGQPGRPAVAVPGVDGLFVAGDWVGPDGLLADAVLGSARSAAMAAAAIRTATPVLAHAG